MNQKRPRAGFTDWLARQPKPNWNALPLTHVTKGILAQDIITEGKIDPRDCPVFKRPISYFFYGRPAYRVAGDGAIKLEAASPVCFVFKPELIEEAASIYAFDTGAFSKRMYHQYLLEEMQIEDFKLEVDRNQPNHLISVSFDSLEQYFHGDTSTLKKKSDVARPDEFLAVSYVNLLKSEGRNEPDDRIMSVEIQVEKEVKLSNKLLAIVVPHTLWNSALKTAWIKTLEDEGVQVLTYVFVPGRLADYYYAQMEAEIKTYYKRLGLI